MSLPRKPAEPDDGGWEGSDPLSREPLPRDPFAGPRPEAYDALTELFLGEQQAAAPQGRPPVLKLVHGHDWDEDDPDTCRGFGAVLGGAPCPAPAPRIEALLLGNLPVTASPWVMQYARHAAAEHGGPAAILRLHHGEGSLTVVAQGRNTEPPPTPHGSLREACEAIAGHIAVWLIRVEEVSEPELVALPQLDSITLLTAADPAATAAAYQSIKHLSPPGAPATGLRLALMGAKADKADAAHDRIARTAEAFLQRRVMVAACIDRISGGRSHQAWSGAVDLPLAEIIADLDQVLRRRVATPDAAPSAPEAVRDEPDATSSAVHASTGPATADPAPPADDLGVFVQSGTPALAAPPGALARAPSPEIETYVFTSVYPPLSPLPGADPSRTSYSAHPAAFASIAAAPAAAEVITEDEAAALLEAGEAPIRETLTRHLPDLAPFPFTCPYAPSVELATSPEGHLHLVALEAPETAAVPALLSAEAWVRDHLPLLAQSAAAIDRPLLESPPTLHLLTMHAPGVLHLRESGIRLHLLVITRAGDDTAWACADLN
ncbi:MAG: hypothetical protein WD749_08480 [Phycisphaerales bacterium]